MTSAIYLFSSLPKKDDTDTLQRKDRNICIDIPLDPKYRISQKLNSNEIEEILEFFRPFEDIVK
jgi:hypothetical protein